MKTTMKYIIAALSLVAAVSCAKEIQETSTVEPLDGAVTFTIHASCAGSFDGNAAKSTLDESYKPLWQAGDAIAVYNGTAWATSSPLTAADIEQDGTSANFTVSIPEAESYTLVFPASCADTETAVEEGVVPISVPAVQTIPAGGCIASDAIVQVCTTEDLNGPVAFRNATSLLAFTAPCEGITSIKFGPKTAGTPVCGAASVDAELGTVSSATGTGALEIASAAGFEEGETYYACVLPGSIAGGLKFSFKKGDEAKAVLTSSKDVEFERNGGMNFSFPAADKLTWVPYLIMNAEDLNVFGSNAAVFEKGEWVKLGADIDLEKIEWTPVRDFVGNFDGQDFSVYNFYTSSNSSSGVGFFGKLTSSCTIRNLKLAVDPATGESDGFSYLAVKGGKGDNFYAGGCVGLIKEIGGEFLIENITTAYNNGSNGVLGKVSNSNTEKNAISFRLGGIVGCVGENTVVTIKNCNNYSYVRAAPNSTSDGDAYSSQYIGGILGLTTASNITIDGCKNFGKIQLWNAYVLSKSGFAAGILARMGSKTTDHNIVNCENHGEITVASNTKSDVYLAGIVGLDNSGTTMTIKDCTNTGTIHVGGESKGVYLGGIAAYLQAKTVISGCTNSGKIYKDANNNYPVAYGGIVGRAIKVDGAKIENCSNSGEIYSTKHDNTAAYAKCFGGIIGLGDIDINNCHNTGSIHFDACIKEGPLVYCGGIAGAFAGINGDNEMSAAKSSITACSCKASMIDATCPGSAAGGLFGYVFDSAISTCAGCSANTAVTATGNAGIIVGSFSGEENASVWGTADSKITVAGSVAGTALDAGNYSQFLCGANGANATFNAEFAAE